MKKVIVKKMIKSEISINEVNKNQIIVGYFNDCVKGWFKLQKLHHRPKSQWQWCGLESTNEWCSPHAGSIEEAIEQFASEHKNEVYVFDSFDEFLEEFPALVESKK